MHLEDPETVTGAVASLVSDSMTNPLLLRPLTEILSLCRPPVQLFGYRRDRVRPPRFIFTTEMPRRLVVNYQGEFYLSGEFRKLEQFRISKCLSCGVQ